MTDSVTIDFSGLANFDPAHPSVPKKPNQILPKPQSQLPGEASVLMSALRLYSKTDNRWAGVIKDSLDLTATGSRVKTAGTSTLKHLSVAPTFAAHIHTFGPSVSGSAGAALGVSGGVFFSNKTPLVGLYASVDYGIIVDISVSLVAQFMFMYGDPASVFRGPPTVLIGVSAGGKGLTGSAFLVCTKVSGRPFHVIGTGFSMGAGASVLPATVFLTTSKTISTVP